MFRRLADLAPADQHAALGEACPQDPGLRGDVAALLQADRHSLDGAFIREAIARAVRDVALRPIEAAGPVRESGPS